MVRSWQQAFDPKDPQSSIMKDSAREVDVIVVGGGFSGIQAAWDVQQAGLSCIVLEARSRIGGRSYSMQARSSESVVELGATWINEITQPKIFATAKRLGLTMVDQFTDGEDVWQLPDGTVLRGRPDAPSLAPITIVIGRLLSTIEDISKDVDLRKFDSFATQHDLDVSAWFKTKGFDDDISQAFINLLCIGLVGRTSGELGIHYLLDYVKSAGGVTNLMGEGKYGAQSLKIREGTSAIATGLASEMLPDSVLVDCPVTEIVQLGDKINVITASGISFLCRKVIVAIPTNVYKNIKFTPSLPPSKRNLVSRTKGGLYVKTILTYSRPWWREAGLVGKFSSLIGPICCSWEVSNPDKQHYSVAFFVVGDYMLRWSELEGMQRDEAVIDHLCTLVGPDLASAARDVLEVNSMNWTAQDFLEGAPTSSMGPGMLSQFGRILREPFKNTHFAGAETAYEWKGYLEGALLAGSRAAEEVKTQAKSSG